MRGQNALDQQQSTMESLNEALERNGQGLAPYLRTKYDAAVRRYQFSTWNGQITTHAMQAGKEVADSTNAGSLEQAYNLAAKTYNNVLSPDYDPDRLPPEAADPIHMARNATMKLLHWNGLDTNADIVNKAIQISDDRVYKAAVEAKFAREQDPMAAAADIRRLGTDKLGEFYAPLLKEFEARADDLRDRRRSDFGNRFKSLYDSGDLAGARALVEENKGLISDDQYNAATKLLGAASAAPATAPKPTPVTTGPNPAATIQIESGGKPQYGGYYAGLGQFSPEEQRRYGITNPNNRRQVEVALRLEAAEFKPQLTAALGREPGESDYYLAHQQGIGGAVAHLTHPDQPAWQTMAQTVEGRARGAGWAKRAIWGNMTDGMKRQMGLPLTRSPPPELDRVTSGDFVRLWDQRFRRAAARVAGSEE